jgi:hypothetical protein
MPVPKEVIEQVDEHYFQVRFTKVVEPIEFFFEFTDTDRVLGKRRIEIRPIHDTPPDVDVAVEVMRKVNNAYMITPQAEVPFSGKIRDDRGLTAVVFSFTVERVESAIGPGSQSVLAASLIALPAGGPGPGLVGTALGSLLGKPAESAP